MEGRCVTERHQVPGGWTGGKKVFCRDVQAKVRGCGGEGRPEALPHAVAVPTSYHVANW
jgi:hypothetical protein